MRRITLSIRFAKPELAPVANSIPTGFRSMSTTSEPESPGNPKAGVFPARISICSVNSALPLPYGIVILALTPMISPIVNPDVRPYFCTSVSSSGMVGVFVGVPYPSASVDAFTSSRVVRIIAASTRFATIPVVSTGTNAASVPI